MYSDRELLMIHVIAHEFAQLQGNKDARIHEVARVCRVIERLCESIRKGSRASAIYQAHKTLGQQMQKAIELYKMKENEDAPPGWG